MQHIVEAYIHQFTVDSIAAFNITEITSLLTSSLQCQIQVKRVAQSLQHKLDDDFYDATRFIYMLADLEQDKS